MRPLSLLFSLMLLATVGGTKAHAEGTYIYSPEGCDFRMVFPEEPVQTRRCHADIPDKCDIVYNYTKVVTANAAMNFYVLCKPIETSVFMNYSQDLIRTTLIGMAGRDKLDTFDTAFDMNENLKRGSILGAGPSHNGQNDMLYMGQIWVNNSSVFSVEGEIVGEASEDVDREFAEIMQSLELKTADNEAVEPPEAEGEKAEETQEDGEEAAE